MMHPSVQRAARHVVNFSHPTQTSVKMLVMNDCFVACLAVNHADDALYSLAEKMVGDRVSHFTFAQLYFVLAALTVSNLPRVYST
jgi:hypothetical protein